MALSVCLISCGEDDSKEEVYQLMQPVNPVSKGSRLLGITISEGQYGFGRVFVNPGIDLL